MKKMNLIFHTRGIQGVISKGLMVFAMMFLFGFGFNTLSAQYVSVEDAYVKLTDANIEIIKNMESLQQSGNTAAIERAKLKQHYLRAMIQELKIGSTVSQTVKKFVAADGSSVNNLDFQLGDSSKSAPNTNWLKDEILELLEL